MQGLSTPQRPATTASRCFQDTRPSVNRYSKVRLQLLRSFGIQDPQTLPGSPGTMSLLSPLCPSRCFLPAWERHPREVGLRALTEPSREARALGIVKILIGPAGL